MGIEIILNNLDSVSLRVMDFFKVNHKLAVFLGGALCRDLDHSLSSVGLKSNQNVTNPFALIMVIVAPFLAGHHFNGD